jgi:disease resistance protein RPS2
MLKDVTWTIKLPSLEELHLLKCDGIETLMVGNDDEVEDEREEGMGNGIEIQEEHHNCYFPKLSTLRLENLPSLKSISWPPFILLFPSLKVLIVKNCSKQDNICLGLNSAKDMEIIHGNQEWWDGLQWKDEDMKFTFLTHFRPRKI